MLYFIILFLAITLIAVGCLLEEKYWDVGFRDGLGFFLFLIGIVFGVAFVVCTVAITVDTITAPAILVEKQQEYISLVYQAENNLYENDNDYGKKELANQIQNWNQTISRRKVNQRNFWIGIFIPNIYDEFELIPMNLLE